MTTADGDYPAITASKGRVMTLRPIYAVVERELLKMVRQRGRLLAQLVRPMIWLFVIGAGFGAVMARQGIADYQRFLVPGVLGMTMLFGAMLGALSTVYDKESGVMRLLVIAPIHHVWVVVAKIISATVAALVQGVLVLLLLSALGYTTSDVSFMLLAAGMIGTSVVCAALGMTVATFSGTLENYALMMNLIIFPVFFVSGSLYPVDMLPGYLRVAALANPFTYGVDVVKHATLIADGVSFGRPEFGLATDAVMIVGFTVLAAVVACLRFSRDSACEPLIHQQSGRHRR
jgi:ABC-2 type transport system permease protein